MSFQQIDQNLEVALDKQFLADVHTFRQNRLNQIAGVLQKMTGMLSKLHHQKSVSEVVSVGVESLSGIATHNDEAKLSTLIIESIHKITEKIPTNIILRQDDVRFKPLEQDSWYATSVKTGKRFAQKLGEITWEQQIPLKNVITYHLLDADEMFQQWVDEDEEMLLRIILELEQSLVNEAGSNGSDRSPSGLQQVLKVFINQINERSEVLGQELAEARSSLKVQLMDAVSKAGTLEQIPGIYRDRPLQKKESRMYRQLCSYTDEWQTLNSKLLNKTASMQQFLVVCRDLETKTSAHTEDVTAYFNQLLIHPLCRFEEKLDTARQQIGHSNPASVEAISAQQSKLSRHIQEHLIEPLNKSLKDEDLTSLIEGLTEPLMKAANGLNGKALFVSRLERDVNPPKLKARSIEWKLLVERGINKQILVNVKPEETSFRDLLEEQLSEIKEIQEIIDINLTSAVELGDKASGKDDPLKIADEALDRTKKKLQKTISRIQEIRQTLCEPVVEGRREFTEQMMSLLYRSDAKSLSVLDTKYKINQKTTSGRTKMRSWWTRARDRTGVGYRFITSKTKQWYTKAATLIGLKKSEIKESKKANITAWLLDTERRIQELPYIYRQLFSIDAIPDRRNYVGVNENFGTIRQAYERWNEGVPVSCAIVGEKGSGKSNYLHLANHELFNEADVWHIDLNNTIWTETELLDLFSEWINRDSIESVDDLITYFNKQNRRIIIFEGIHNLYLRHLNGYEGIEQLIYLISETSENVFWVASCSRYAWSFLNEAADIGNYFSPVIQTDTLDEQKIERVILNRHGSSGYELVFDANESDKKNRSYRKLMNDEAKAQEHLREKYFKDLTELSDGNASIAMIFWIRSIREFDDTNCYIAPLEVDSLDMVEELTPDVLFVLAAVVLHDTLNPDELSAVLGINKKESKLIFNRLKAKGILVAQENGVALNHLMYRQTIRELKERNILHLE